MQSAYHRYRRHCRTILLVTPLMLLLLIGCEGGAPNASVPTTRPDTRLPTLEAQMGTLSDRVAAAEQTAAATGQQVATDVSLRATAQLAPTVAPLASPIAFVPISYAIKTTYTDSSGKRRAVFLPLHDVQNVGDDQSVFANKKVVPLLILTRNQTNTLVLYFTPSLLPDADTTASNNDFELLTIGADITMNADGTMNRQTSTVIRPPSTTLKPQLVTLKSTGTTLGRVVVDTTATAYWLVVSVGTLEAPSYQVYLFNPQPPDGDDKPTDFFCYICIAGSCPDYCTR